MAAWEAEMEAWGMAELENPIRRPVDPMTVRNDLRLSGTQPELFLIDDAGQLATPRYYPHYAAQDLVQNAFRDVSESLAMHSRRAEFMKAEGQRFRSGKYNQLVTEALQRNFHRVQMADGLHNVLSETIQHYGLHNWKKGDPLPAGYRLSYPDGFRVWETTTFENQVMKMAEEVGSVRGLRAIENRVLAESVIEGLAAETGKIVRTGKPVPIPIEIAEHLKNHLSATVPAIEVLTDIGGATSFWRTWTLPFRTSWQVVNETTNAMLTGIAGNLPSARRLKQLRGRGIDAIGPFGGSTIMPEFGESFGYSARTQSWLRDRGMGKLADFNRWLHNTPLMRFGRTGQARIAGRTRQTPFGAEFNQARDDFYKSTNMLGEIERDIRTAGRGEVGLNIGTRTLRPAEVAEITRSGELMLDTIEEVLSAAPYGGKAHYLQSMSAKAAEAVYSWNALTPWQKQYMSRIIPFSGWQLFTTGYLMRMPARYPGRAWVLKSLANIGKQYIDNAFEGMGVDPNTVEEWDTTSVPLYVNEDGQVVVMRANFFRLYDMMGVEDISRTVLSHPMLTAMLAAGGTETFPEFGPTSTPPRQWGQEEPGKKHPLDIIGEMLLGPTYDLANKLAHPYVQYGTGGLVRPEPVMIEGERIERDWRSTLTQYTLGLSFREYDSYQMMDRAHGKTRSGVNGARLELSNMLKDTQGQDLDGIRAVAETYLMRAYQYLDQIEAMGEHDDADMEALRRDFTRYTNQAYRIEFMLNYMRANPGASVPPEMIEAQP